MRDVGVSFLDVGLNFQPPKAMTSPDGVNLAFFFCSSFLSVTNLPHSHMWLMFTAEGVHAFYDHPPGSCRLQPILMRAPSHHHTNLKHMTKRQRGAELLHGGSSDPGHLGLRHVLSCLPDFH